MRLSSLNGCHQLIGKTYNFGIFSLQVTDLIFEAEDLGLVYVVGLEEVIGELIVDFQLKILTFFSSFFPQIF